MKMKSRRGFAFVAALPWVAGSLLAAFGYHEYATVFAPGRNKAKADKAAVVSSQTAQQASDNRAAADAVKLAVAQAVAAHAKEIAVRDAIDQNVAGFVEGARQAINADPAPSDADRVALSLLDSATAALGQPLTKEQRAVWGKLVANLIAKNAAAQAKLAQMTAAASALRASLDATQAHAAAADAQARELATQLSAKATELAATATKAATLAAQNKQWADHEPDMLARIKALGCLAALLAAGLAWYEIRRRGLVGAIHDAVALKEHVQSEAVAAGASVEKLQASVESWWADDPAARRAYDAAKTQLRL